MPTKAYENSYLAFCGRNREQCEAVHNDNALPLKLVLSAEEET